MRTCARPAGARAGAVVGVVVAVLLSLTGCAVGGAAAATTAIGSIHRSGTAGLDVLSARGETLAVAPVEIDGKGPFPFIVDTGSSRSVVDKGIADKIGLRTGRASQQVSGVG